MPTWEEVLKEIEQEKVESALDRVRRRYLEQLSKKTGRNVIAYYSGWLTSPVNSKLLSIVDADMNAIMTAVHKLDRSKGLDLILHTPGGDMAATEAIVSYLQKMFGKNIRAIIPQIAMSGGTMIAFSCKEIIMGKQSSLGPIDPQMGGLPAGGVIAEFDEAVAAIKNDPGTLPLWQTIIGKYHPTFLGECKNAMTWAENMASEWLKTGMFVDDEDKEMKIATILAAFSDHSYSLNHGKHFGIDECRENELSITELEVDDEFHDLVLTVHHAFMHTFSRTSALKVIENQLGIATYFNPPNR